MKLMQAIGGAGHGGAENFFVHLSDAFEQSGMDQHIACRSHPVRDQQLLDADVSYENLKFGGALDLLTPLRLQQIANRYKPDVYLSWMSRAASMTPKGSFPKLARIGGYYKLKYFKKCNHLIGITPHLCEYLIQEGWPEAKVHYVPNFLDYREAPALNRSDFETPEDVPLLLVLGRLHPIKGIDVAIKALADVPEAYLWIAGEGPMEEALKTLADDLGVQNRVRFLGWRTDKEALLATADITVFPSRQEGFGNVILESWASQTPMVASKAQGPKAYIEDGVTGLLSDIEKSDQLAASINQLIDDKTLFKSIVTNGLNKYQSGFTKEQAVTNWTTVFKSVQS
jgi:glycosyltransferase involved in cell wall biosynthesis